jgi:N-acetylneuraminic acid mutarotase
VLVAGGMTRSIPTTLSSAELYDPTSGGWTMANAMNAARSRHTATLLTNGLVLVAGGNGSGGPLNSAELYDATAGTWTLTGSMTNGRWFHTATLLPSGQVLVAGGNGSNGVSMANTELYDPGSGTWITNSPLNTGRAGHTSTLLANGQILVAGGSDTNGNALASTELFNPANGTWTEANPMNVARYSHTATLLPNGEVLVAGGQGVGGYLSSVELYNPASNTWTTVGVHILPTPTSGSETATSFPDGHVLMAGGVNNTNVVATAELYVAQANPPPFSISAVIVAGACQLTFTNTPGQSFGVLASTNLNAGAASWTFLDDATEFAPGQYQFIDTQAAAFPQHFYRVSWPSP